MDLHLAVLKVIEFRVVQLLSVPISAWRATQSSLVEMGWYSKISSAYIYYDKIIATPRRMIYLMQ